MMNSKLHVREITLYAILGAILYALKMVMAGLPNIEPVSLLVMVYALALGWKSLWSVYIYVLLECLTWGFHSWTISYLYLWLLLFTLTRFLHRMESPLLWAILSGAFGLCFGLLCIPVQFFAGGWAYALSWWISGIPYDLLHCAGNFGLTLLLFRPALRTLQILKEKSP